jgi:hypothetical protein
MTENEIWAKIKEKLIDGSLPRDLTSVSTRPILAGKTLERSFNISSDTLPSDLCSGCDERRPDFAFVKPGRRFPFHSQCSQIYHEVG